MYRRLFLALIATAGLALPAWSGNTQLTASEIETLLANNTVRGVWAGSSYKQWFSAGGLTIYIQDGHPPSEGRWRANADTNEYESWWRSTGWTPYVIVRTDDGGHAYINGDTLEPFTVTAGRHID